MTTCCMAISRYLTGLLSTAPSERQQVMVAFPICLPDQHCLRIAVLAVSRYLVKLRFWCVACSTDPEPAKLRVGLVGCTKPWLHERISISFSWPAAVLLASIAGSSNLMYMLGAIVFLPQIVEPRR